MRKDLKDELMERLVGVLGPLRYSSIVQVTDVIDLVEEVVDNYNDRRENERLNREAPRGPHGHGPGYD